MSYNLNKQLSNQKENWKEKKSEFQECGMLSTEKNSELMTFGHGS